MVTRAIARLRKVDGSPAGEPFPKELELLVQHLILSHQGKGEWGSPKAPMHAEAQLLHFADNLSADLFKI